MVTSRLVFVAENLPIITQRINKCICHHCCIFSRKKEANKEKAKTQINKQVHKENTQMNELNLDNNNKSINNTTVVTGRLVNLKVESLPKTQRTKNEIKKIK